MQQALDMGVAAVDTKIANRRLAEENAPPEPEPVDDGHEETVEEVKAKMAAAQKAMDEGLSNVNKHAEEAAAMPDFSALSTLGDSFHRIGASKQKRQVNLLAGKLGVQAQQGDEMLSPAALSQVMIKRALAAGKTQQEIDEALKD